MRQRTVVAHRLADLPEGEMPDHPRTDHEARKQCGQRAENRPERQVLEHVEAGVILREQFGEPQQHQLALLARSAARTRSMRAEREPLNSTVTPGSSSSFNASASDSTSVKCRPP